MRSWQLIPTQYVVDSHDTIGGRPLFAAGQSWPRCHCGEKMVLFFQLDVHAEYGLPFAGGSHLLAFMCWKHTDATTAYPRGTTKLPDQYWTDPRGAFFRFVLNRPGPAAPTAESEPRLAAITLVPTEVEDGNLQSVEFKIGGKPDWAQAPELYACSCGAPMAYLCQVPENFEFESAPGQPVQTGNFGEPPPAKLIELLAANPTQRWMLFLGNAVYVTACTAQCRPEAVWPVCQN